ncbi:MAG: aminotransferase class III-fold pyridoxal phosphate-dependent enzyme [Polyangiaceae bacterium]|nr:aminotransferase class III-fold pyridoxal phosphate-dependent enzyme [Polyangiaceae bacterium]
MTHSHANSPRVEVRPAAPGLQRIERLVPSARKPEADPTTASAAYARYCRPKLVDLLQSLRLDVSYEKASGSYLYLRDGDHPDALTPVLDLVSGFGACLLGHNPPELKWALVEQLDQDTPVFAQSAVHGAAARLATQLNDLLGTKGRYLCTFTNSGTESVEAALKHAYKVRFDWIRRTYERVTRELHELCTRIEVEGLEVALPDSTKPASKFRDDLDERNVAELDRFRRSPVVIALKGSFHGKTSAALKVTFNQSYREGYEGLSAIEPIFVDPAEVARLPEIVGERSIEFLVPRLEHGRVVVERLTATRAVALIFEIVMGEGGIRELSASTLSSLAALHAELGVPYVIDEIQTGCGRTGAMFAYAATALGAIEPEYLLLGKALGGGLVKIGATLIHERVYDPDFGILHTSTFAEDDPSCTVASRALDAITRDRGALLTEIREKGSYLKARLEDLAREHPDLVREVRGRGLMLGLELGSPSDRSPLFRQAARQGFLSLLIASYLLHHHRIRVLAPLTTLLKGNPGKQRASILRIQPAVTITRLEIDRFVAALREALAIIDCNDEFLLVGHLVGQAVPAERRRAPQPRPVAHPLPERREDIDARVGFVCHATSLAHLVEYYLPSFARYRWDEQRVVCWWNRLAWFLEPDVVHVAYVTHDDFVVEANLVAVPYLPETMIQTLVAAKAGRPWARRRLEEIQDRIQDAVTVARELGDDAVPTSMVGLGAFTSIVTHNGTTLNDHEVPITTGNAYTAGLMIEAIAESARWRGLMTRDTTAAVVGAAGNIGSVLAALLCERSQHVRLIGQARGDGLARLVRVREACLGHVLELAAASLSAGQSPAQVQLSGLAGAIYAEVLRPLLEGNASSPDQVAVVAILRGAATVGLEDGARLDRLVAEHHRCDTNPYLTVHTDLDALRDADIVAVATNSTDSRLITPETVRRGAIVCSASVPSDLSRAFADHLDDYCVFDGGFTQLPEGNTIDWIGMPGEGRAFGCLGETLLMGFEGRNRTFAKGTLTATQVRTARELAAQHGFRLGAFKLAEAVHPCPDLATPGLGIPAPRRAS